MKNWRKHVPDIPAAERAIKDSLAHWRRMRNAKADEHFGDEEPCARACALCKLTWNESCDLCPLVLEDKQCGTTYGIARKAWVVLHIAIVCSRPGIRSLRAEWRARAQDMIDDLAGLLK